MKLSYIVPVYKVEQYLRQCIDSILAQTMDDYEIILVDDGSPDNCPAICDGYRDKYPDIVKVVHKENGGLASARNAGLDVAQGEYVFFFDSDDYCECDGVLKLYDKAAEYNADVLQTTYFYFNELDGSLSRTKPLFENERVYSHSDMEEEICSSNKKGFVTYVWRNLYRRQFLLDNGIRFEEKLRMIEDAPFDTWAFTKSDRFVAVDIPVYCYRIRKDSMQRQKYIENYESVLELQSKVKIKYYTENCNPKNEFYEDLAENIIIKQLPFMLRGVYKNKPAESFGILKQIGNSEVMKMSFRYYDINKFKSKSLDWWMTWCVKYRIYPIAHLICKKVLYK